MVNESDQLGASTLALLAESSTIQILRELSGGPLRPIELKQQLPDVAHSGLMRQLGELAQWGAVRHERIVGLPTRAYYSLAEAGQALLEIPEASLRWERQWSSQTRPDTHGAWALRLLADERARTILQALGDEPMRPLDLERLPGVSRSATRRRLRQLLHNGILIRVESDRHVHYELTACARRLALIAMHAAHWEHHWASQRPAVMASSLPAASPEPRLPATPATPAPRVPGG